MWFSFFIVFVYFILLSCMLLTEPYCWEYTRVLIYTRVWLQVCPSHAAVTGNMSLCPSWNSLQWTGSMYKILGTSPFLTLQQKTRRRVWGEARENPESLRVFPGCWGHLWDHQIPQVQTVWCEMHCCNILCQLSSTPQAMRKLVRKCSLFFSPKVPY